MIILLMFSINASAGNCVGKFINPVTDVCWSCLFPLSIGPVHVNSGGLPDTDNPSSLLCLCPRPPIPAPVPGIPVGFWEPVRLIDVTRTPYCMVTMGGISFANSNRIGTHTLSGDKKRGREHSFYHVHWYVYPILFWLEILTDFICLEKSAIDLAYLTELDPTWVDDELGVIFSPEVLLFANPIAQGACAIDCAMASTGTSGDPFFWCAGCQGGIYPFTGNVDDHAGGVQASLLMTIRIAAKLHRVGASMGTCGKEALCGAYAMPVIKKKQYRTQMVYPKAATTKEFGCHPMGKGSVRLEAGREFPWKGEDFGYLLWRKRNCCCL